MRRWLAGSAWLLWACTPADTRPDLLLITFDTTRADAVGAYGASPSPTPNLDALAAGGLRIEEAMTVAPLTLPSHTSMLSGLAPDLHGVRDNGQRVPDDLELLSESLSQAGWQTGAVVSAIVLDGGLGLDQGFDHYADGFDLTRVEGLHDPEAVRPAQSAADEALRWLQAQDDGPVFLWVHLYDPHHPLRPPPAFRAAQPDPYLAEVAYADHHAGRVIDAIRARPRGEVIVAVADHGEGRGEHGESTHGQFVYRSTMRVPLIVAGTGVSPEVRPGPASVVDVAATLRDAADLPPAVESDGLSLLAGGGADPTRRVYGESYHQRNALGLAALHVWQDGRFRVIDAPRPELYDWLADPAEQADVMGAVPGAAAELVHDFDPFRASRSPRSSTPASLDPATEEALRRLGYLQGSAPAADEVLPDPKDFPDLQARVDALVTLARTRPPGEAVPMLRAFAQEHPRIYSARVLLSRALQLSGSPAEAIEVDRALLADKPGDVGVIAHLGELYAEAGDPDQALEHLRQAQQLRPDNAAIAAALGELLRRAGRCAEAQPALDRAVAANPHATRARLVRGACARDLGDVTRAAADLEQVLAEDPHNADVRYLLGVVRLAQGRPSDAVPLLEDQLRRTPDAAQAHGALGLALVSVGRGEEALPSLMLAAPDPSTGVDAPLALARVLLDLDRPDAEIARWLDEAARRGPADPRVLELRSAHLLHLGQAEKAVEVMVEARRLRERLQRAPPHSPSP